MKKNMGVADRTIRVLLAIVVVVLLLTGQLAGALGVILGILAAIFVVTSAVGFCPLYVPLGISTRKKTSA